MMAERLEWGALDNEISRCLVGLDRGLGVGRHRGRGRSLAFVHERAVAADQWMVCSALRPSGLPASTLGAKEICGA